MDIDKLTEQILEITNNSDYGWIDLDSSDADRIRVALTKALTIPVVVGRSEQSNCVHCHEHILTVKTLKYKCKHCGDEKWEQLD